MKFKVGDRVKYTSGDYIDSESNPLFGGKYGEIIGTIIEYKDGILPVCLKWDNGTTNNYNESDLELAEENPFHECIEIINRALPIYYSNYSKTTMSKLITTFKNITRSEPNKTFVKAGVMNENFLLTEEGKELFIQYLFDQNADLFKKNVVDAIVAEQEKK